MTLPAYSHARSRFLDAAQLDLEFAEPPADPAPPVVQDRRLAIDQSDS